MNKVYFGAILCALFCGGWLAAGCSQLPITVANQSSAFPTLFAPTATSPLSTVAAIRLPTKPVSRMTPTRQALPRALTATPIPPVTPPPLATIAGAAAESAPAPAPVGTVVFYEDSVTLLTYPFERYQSDAVDPTYQWPYKRFDVERFRLEAPTPAPRTYRLLILENTYLKITILPELGGRIWQVVHKPSGLPMFYQNDVVKPTHWGIENQKGWLALGGLEWSLPVAEHGYDWGTKWGYLPLPHSENLAAVTLFTPQDGRALSASINIVLRAGAAGFEIEPTLKNLTTDELAFSFWHDAMLAPGSGKHPSADLNFVLPSEAMTLHSTNDPTLPLPGRRFPWPTYAGRDFSRLGNFHQYLGFFEAPAAHGPFVGVYDPTYDAGAVRVFPANIMRGSKVFALGWQDALTSDNYTDDQSMYVELHGGLAPTFADQTQLPAGGQVSWREVWYPVVGIGNLTFANELAALAIQPHNQQLRVDLYVTRPLDGEMVYLVEGAVRERVPFRASPNASYQALLTTAAGSATTTNATATIQLQDKAGRVLLTYQLP